MYKLYNGDCLSLMQKIRPESVDVVVADPPYGINYQSQRKKDKQKWMPRIEKDKAPFIWFLHNAAVLLKQGGAIICFCRFDSWTAFSSACEIAGLTVRAEIVWDKMTHGAGDLNGCCGFRHEIAVFATKGRFLFHGKRPQSLYQSARVSPQKLIHPNEKPVDLFEWIIEHYCPPGGTILDPFMGSGVTGVACAKKGRDFVGIEINDKYFQIAKDRIEAEHQKMMNQ